MALYRIKQGFLRHFLTEQPLQYTLLLSCCRVGKCLSMYFVVQFHFLCIHMISITLMHTEARNHCFSCVVSDMVVFCCSGEHPCYATDNDSCFAKSLTQEQLPAVAESPSLLFVNLVGEAASLCQHYQPINCTYFLMWRSLCGHAAEWTWGLHASQSGCL